MLQRSNLERNVKEYEEKCQEEEKQVNILQYEFWTIILHVYCMVWANVKVMNHEYESDLENSTWIMWLELKSVEYISVKVICVRAKFIFSYFVAYWS